MRMRRTAGLGVAIAAVGLVSAAKPPVTAAKVQEALASPAATTGYLPRGGAPNSLAMIPPPPEAGSAALARDEAAAKVAQAQQSGPRWEVATLDADLSTPAATQAFSCAADVDVSEASTPTLYRLLRRSLLDLGVSPYPTKTKYQRTRPYVATNTAMCTPAYDAVLRRDGSYPSGHSAIGWGWALILAEAAPERADQILARGRAFGHSRMICNVHWLSDTEEGRVIGAATVAKMHALPEFRADIEAARAEILAARQAGKRPTRDCAAEAAALAGG
jgi:acid phosphatase (class A)